MGGERWEETRTFWEGVSDDLGRGGHRLFQSKVELEADVKQRRKFWSKKEEEEKMPKSKVSGASILPR